uniref:Homing endonuclease n=1 Tax=Powellomyces hirtus TaxID=109895 RepID=A0A4P8NPA4_9FUNG|nr:Homing endonuclease [Powellomyces hirtus]
MDSNHVKEGYMISSTLLTQEELASGSSLPLPGSYLTPVYVYSSSTFELIHTYRTLSAAAKAYDVDPSTIRRYIDTRHNWRSSLIFSYLPLGPTELSAYREPGRTAPKPYYVYSSLTR